MYAIRSYYASFESTSSGGSRVRSFSYQQCMRRRKRLRRVLVSLFDMCRYCYMEVMDHTVGQYFGSGIVYMILIEEVTVVV